MDEIHLTPMDTTDSPSLDSMKADYDELYSINLQTRIHALRRINRLIMFRDDESRTGLLHALSSRLLVEEDKDAKALIVMALEKLAHLPSFDGSKILQILMNQTETDSTKLKCQIYDCIFRILKIKHFNTYNSPDFARLLQALSKLVIKELSDSHYRIRSICIQLLTSLPSLISRTKSIHEQSGQKIPYYPSEQEIQTIIRNYGTDVDPRVRRTALKSLLRLHQRGCKLELSLYDLCKESLKDDYEEVRIEALNLIWVLSSLYPNSTVKPFLDNSLDKSVRLVDDAFIRICDIISDVSVNVRSKASTLLGSYRQAEGSILLQTFSKEKMTNFGRQKGRYMDDVKTVKIIPTPEGDFDVQDEFRLLDSGACGAFVHGLEDEYQDVRYATIDSICELCMHNSTFAEKAVDFLVDMFHDEIDSVRLNAINSLRKISTNAEIIFNREQLTIALSVLDDADPTVRESTHGLLRTVRLAEQDMVMKLIEIMKNNVTRYPEDQLSIYQCFRDFGAKHNDFIEYLVPVFFTLEQGFKPVEKHVDDPKHIGHVIMTFNAAHSNSKILKIIPDYLWRHYTYLRDKFPSCFFEIQMPSNLSKPTKQKGVDFHEDGQNVQKFMEEILTTISNLESLFKGDLDTAKRNARVCLRDLKYIAHVAPLLSGKAEFAIMYLECVKIIIEIKQNYLQPNFIVVASNLAGQLLALSYVMENTFLGLPGQARRFFVTARLLANLVWIVGSLRQINKHNHSQEIAKNLFGLLLKRLTHIQTEFGGEDSNLNQLGDFQSRLQRAHDHTTVTTITPLFDYIESFVPPTVDFRNLLKRSDAVIIEPAYQSTTEQVFNSEFPLRIRIIADVFNVADTGRIGVQVTFPDQKVRQFWPPSSQFVLIKPFYYRLKTSIEISQSSWTAKCSIEIKIIRSFETDIPDLDECILRQTATRDVVSTTSCGTIALSKVPLNYKIWPTHPIRPDR